MSILSNSDHIAMLADKSNWEGQKGAGLGDGFVEQDKGPCGTVWHFWRIPQRTRHLFAAEGRMSWIPYRTADWIPGSPAFWLRISGLNAMREVTALGAGILLLGWALIGFGKVFGILVANTDSAAPAGVYRVVASSFRRGDLVAACLPVAIAQAGLARGYLWAGPCTGNAEPVGKIAGALPGDTVAIERDGVTINGKRIPRSTVTARDSAGRPLAHVPFGTYTVAADQIWLFGFHDRRSWDARYFGPVPLSSVRGALAPVLTW
jgi:conjugative transfer signal peptidase TraF